MKKKLILLTIGLLCSLSALCQSQLERGKQYYEWRDYARALPLLQQAAKEGYGEACYLLGNMYYYGNGTEKNYTIAMRMYQRGLEFGYHLGNMELGIMYENGDGCTKDPGKAFAYYSKSRLAGEKLGMYQVARCCYHGIGIKENNEQAYALFSSLYQDYGFRKEYEWAWQWSCMYLGFCYQYGYGTEIDLEKAVECYKNSEKPDYLYRASRLVRLYSLWKYNWQNLLDSAVGKGCDEGRALYEYVQLKLEKWNGAIDAETFNYLVQATETYPLAWKLLGDCYRLGHGTAANMIKARECYAKAEANREAIEEIEEAERQEEQRIAAEKQRIEQEKQAEKERVAREKQAEKERLEREEREAAEKAAQQLAAARQAVAARYKEGDLYEEDGTKGVVVRRSETRVLIIAMSDDFGSWPGRYAGYTEGWRLPTREELNYIQRNQDRVNKLLGANGGNLIRSGVYYWSAAQGFRANEKIASNGGEISRDYSNKNYIRLVRDY